MQALQIPFSPGCRHNDNVSPFGRLVPGHFRETDFIAQEHPNLAKRRHYRVEQFIPRFRVSRFLVAKSIIQMGLSVGTFDFPVVVHHNAGIVVPVIIVIMHRFVHAKDHPDPVFLGQLSHSRNKGTIDRLGCRKNGLPIRSFRILEHKPFREYHKVRVILGFCIFNCLFCLLQIIFRIWKRL